MKRLLLFLSLSSFILAQQPTQRIPFQETTAPVGAPSPGFASCWFDGTSHFLECLNSSNQVITLNGLASALSGTPTQCTNQLATGIAANGNANCTNTLPSPSLSIVST